jgi:predicted dehydrogenase
MSMLPLRTTLVGCGAAAQKLYSKPLRGLERQGVLRVTALVDRHAGHAATLRASFPRATVHEDLGRALESGQSDLTLILSPIQLHAGQAILALRHDNHVLCEKPMASTVERCDAMIAAARQARRILAVGMVRRFFPAFALMRKLVANGTLGEIRSFSYREGRLFDWDVKTPAGFIPHPEGGSGLLYDIGPHVFDYLIWLFGALEVISYADDALEGGVEGNISVQVKSPVCPGSIRLSWDYPMKNELRVVGSRGEAVLRLDEFDRLAIGNGSAFDELTVNHTYPVDLRETSRRGISPRLYTESIRCQLVQVARAIRLGEPPAVAGEEGGETVRVIESARRLARPIDMPWLDEGRERAYRDLHWTKA